MKPLQFIVIFFILISTTTLAQDTYTQLYGVSKEVISTSFQGNQDFEKFPSGDYYTLLYRLGGGTEKEMIIYFYFSNPDAKCVGVSNQLPIGRLEHMVHVLKSKYPNYNKEETKFWSENEIVQIEINEEKKHLFIIYIPK